MLNTDSLFKAPNVPTKNNLNSTILKNIVAVNVLLTLKLLKSKYKEIKKQQKLS